jgi:hypothetical protein
VLGVDVIVIGLAGLLTGASLPAWAQDAPAAPASVLAKPIVGLARIVELTSGQVVQGRLMAEVPGQYLLLQTAEGETRRWAWSEIAAVRVAELQPNSPAIEAYDPRTIEAHVVGEPRVRLSARLRQEESADWQPICQLPCERMLSRQYLYRVDGPGIPASTFKLPTLGVEVRVQVRAGSRVALGAGASLLAVGTASVASGVGLSAVGLIGALLGGSGPDLLAGGAALLLTGVPMTIGGIILLGRGPTDVKVRLQPDGSVALLRRLDRRLWLTQSGLAF